MAEQYSVHVRRPSFTLPRHEQVMRRIEGRKQQIVLLNGTHSYANWRYDARNKAARSIEFVPEPDDTGEKVVARCISAAR